MRSRGRDSAAGAGDSHDAHLAEPGLLTSRHTPHDQPPGTGPKRDARSLKSAGLDAPDEADAAAGLTGALSLSSPVGSATFEGLSDAKDTGLGTSKCSRSGLAAVRPDAAAALGRRW